MRKIVFKYKDAICVYPIDWDNEEISAEDAEIEFLSLHEMYDAMKGLLGFIGHADLVHLRELADEMSMDKSEEIEWLGKQNAELKHKLAQKYLCEWANKVNQNMGETE